MAGFKNLRQWADASDDGQEWITGFRKAASTAATVTGGWTDYGYYSGSPAANFYASSPLEAAEVEASRGIYVPSVAPAKQFLRNLKLMSGASGATSTANSRQQILLADVLMYYPFIDTDAVGEQQDMVNGIVLPRYDYGKVIAIGQSASSALGQFTFSYTNQDGVAGRTSPIQNSIVVASGGQIVATGGGNTSSYLPFLSLQAGDHGVQSIESVTFTVGGGGLMCLAIVHPVLMAYVTQECRRTTSGNLESYGACSEFASIIHHRPPEIKDGAVLDLFACGFGGSLASSFLAGLLETTWN